MKITNLKYNSGLKITKIKRAESFDADGNPEWFSANVLTPIDKDSFSLFEVDVPSFYEDLLIEATKIKDGSPLIDSILQLGNRYGYLNFAAGNLQFHKYKTTDKDSFVLQTIMIEERIKLLESREYFEMTCWESLLTKLIPSTQPWFSTYIKSNNYSLSLDDLNKLIDGGLTLEYKSLNRTSYDVKPKNLLAALIFYSRTIKPRKRTSTQIICGYSKCNNIIYQNLGVGRSRVTCSDSCRTLKARENRNKL